MTTAQDTVAETNHSAADFFTKMWQPWVDNAQKFASIMPVTDAKTMDARAASMDELIDSYYDFAAHMLSAHRDVVKSGAAVARAAVKNAVISTQSVVKTPPAKKI